MAKKISKKKVSRKKAATRSPATRKKAAAKRQRLSASDSVARASEQQAQQTAPRAEAPFLEEVLVALQKSFSRVNNQSAEVPEHQARALMVGDVDFQLSLNVDPYRDAEHATADRLLVKSGGGISLTLSGRIDTDIRVAGDQDED